MRTILQCCPLTIGRKLLDFYLSNKGRREDRIVKKTKTENFGLNSSLISVSIIQLCNSRKNFRQTYRFEVFQSTLDGFNP